MRSVLVVDIGGTNVKILATGQKDAAEVPSGRELTPRKMVAEVKALSPGRGVRRGRDRLPGTGSRRSHRGRNRATSPAGGPGSISSPRSGARFGS